MTRSATEQSLIDAIVANPSDDSTGRPWNAQNIIHAETPRKRTGLNGYPHARNGRGASGRRTRSAITHDTARLANRLSVNPAYCWI